MRFVKKNNDYYLERKTTRRGNNKSVDEDCNYRDWWLVKYNNWGTTGVLRLGNVSSVPEELVGKRVKIKLEIIKDKEVK